MSITSRQEKAAAKWMQEHNVRPPCSACGSESGWNMHESTRGGSEFDLKNRKA